MPTDLVLHEIPWSHDCEKARLCLDFKDLASRRVPVNPATRREVRRIGARGPVPVLQDGARVIEGSPEMTMTRRRTALRALPAIAARAVLALLGALLAALLAAPAATAAIRLPPPGDRSVHDLASVVRPEDAATMERWHKALFDACGVAIVVVTVPDLEGEPIEDFATRVGTEWGVGKKGEDRGIVVALSLAPRRIHIATGYGVEGFLPDGRVGGLIDREVRPILRAGDYSRGLVQASAALTAAAAQEYGLNIEGLKEARAARRQRPRGPVPIAALLILAVLAIMFIAFAAKNPAAAAILLAGSRGRRGRGGFGGFGGGGFGGGGGGFGGFGGGGFGGGGAGRGF